MNGRVDLRILDTGIITLIDGHIYSLRMCSITLNVAKTIIDPNQLVRSHTTMNVHSFKKFSTIFNAPHVIMSNIFWLEGI